MESSSQMFFLRLFFFDIFFLKEFFVIFKLSGLKIVHFVMSGENKRYWNERSVDS